jgi:hypothetical protein
VVDGHPTATAERPEETPATPVGSGRRVQRRVGSAGCGDDGLRRPGRIGDLASENLDREAYVVRPLPAELVAPRDQLGEHERGDVRVADRAVDTATCGWWSVT